MYSRGRSPREYIKTARSEPYIDEFAVVSEPEWANPIYNSGNCPLAVLKHLDKFFHIPR